MTEFKIVADSSASIFELGDMPFAAAPLKIRTSEAEYIDNEQLDVDNMVNTLLAYKGRSSTSCPNTDDWLSAFGDAKHIFCITISASLSGCYNAACVAKELYEEKYPDRKVFVFNSLSTGPEMILIMQKVAELHQKGMDFEEVCNEAVAYAKKCGLFFILESMKNLANNGRVNPLVAKSAGLLGIRALGKASSKGELQMLDKCRGEKKTVLAVIKRLHEHNFKEGKINIAHCSNPDFANLLEEAILEEFPNAKTEVSKCGGLCGFYAEKGGIIIGFEMW